LDSFSVEICIASPYTVVIGLVEPSTAERRKIMNRVEFEQKFQVICKKAMSNCANQSVFCKCLNNENDNSYMTAEEAVALAIQDSNAYTNELIRLVLEEFLVFEDP
jgi:hypothetical protein